MPGSALSPPRSFPDPRMRAAEGPAPRLEGSTSCPGSCPAVGRAGPELCSGSSEAGVPRGEAHALPAPAQPRPSCLCRAQLRAPGPAEARCPPRPGASLTSQGREPVLPGMPGSSQRVLFPRGSESPRILLILLLGRQEKN